jgi:hypothetical protein
MRNGWPNSEDGRGISPASQGHVPFGPEVSWPTGFAALEQPSGGYGYPATRGEQLPAAAQQGSHPYAAFGGSGYGDDGYTDPGYQGPSAQDAGIAGTRTVRGFVESGQTHAAYPETGYAQNGYFDSSPRMQSQHQQGYAGSSYASGEIEMAYPAPPEAPHGADLYKQPWDYDQPLRYDGEDDTYPPRDAYMQVGDYGDAGGYGGQRNDGAERYQPAAYDPTAYNGSDYSMPGINGPGYDLSGIIGTSDFEAVGYDEPSYGRLAYDDPRYDDPQRRPQPGQRFDQTRFDTPRFDDTRLDSLWRAGEDVRREAGPGGYGNDGFGDSRGRSESPASFDAFDSGGRGGRGRSAETRYDMKALVEPGDNTRFDVPRFDDTRMDNLRALTPARGLRSSGALMTAPPAARPRGWAEDTSFDHFADLDLTDEPVPAAFTRTLERPDDRSLDRPLQDDDTAARRAVGKRRGRSGDRRQWMALGAIAVVAAGAIGGVLMKYVFAGPSGPAHQVVAPQSVDGFTRSANLEKQLDVAAEAQKVAKASGGQASDVVYGVYQMGPISATALAANTQMFMFVGGKLAGADPSSSVANFEQTYTGATAVSAGTLGGDAACTETHLNGQSASMCVWFDNDTFGTVVSPTMTTAKLAATMVSVRPSLELLSN